MPGANTLRALGYIGLSLACTPLRDLDDSASERAGEASGGRSTGWSGAGAGSAKQGGAANQGGAWSGSAGGAPRGGSSSDGGRSGSATGASGNGGTSSATGGNSSGGEPPETGGAAGAIAEGGTGAVGAAGDTGNTGSGEGGSGPTSGGVGSGIAGSTGGRADASDLPLDFPDSPVMGTFTVSSDATWEVDGVFEPTFEIHTPTASYWVAKPLGMLVSMVDTDENAAAERQWIDFSSGFRPLRGLPSYGTFDAHERMSTTLDSESQTPTHVRLFSSSESGEIRLTWDFYPTHVTLTVNAMPVPYGLAYRGVPAGTLDSGDRLVFADGNSQSAQLASSVADLPGPAEWAYLSDPARGRSLFLVQHSDDDITDRYQVKDNDSSMLSFGDGELTQLPLRFSFGVVESAEYADVKARAEFVISAIQ
jgi:hypothetical protein